TCASRHGGHDGLSNQWLYTCMHILLILTLAVTMPNVKASFCPVVGPGYRRRRTRQSSPSNVPILGFPDPQIYQIMEAAAASTQYFPNKRLTINKRWSNQWEDKYLLRVLRP